MSQAAYVFVQGPECEGLDRRGEELYLYWITIYDGQDEELKTYKTPSYSKACTLGENIASDRSLELVNEASR